MDEDHDVIAKGDLARLHRIEDAARDVLDGSQGRRSATPLLSAIAALRVPLKKDQEPTGS